MTHKLGWMAMLPSGETYNWFFENMDHLTNISYSAKFYSFKVRPDRNLKVKAGSRQSLLIFAVLFLCTFSNTAESVCDHQPQLHPEPGQV